MIIVIVGALMVGETNPSRLVGSFAIAQGLESVQIQGINLSTKELEC